MVLVQRESYTTTMCEILTATFTEAVWVHSRGIMAQAVARRTSIQGKAIQVKHNPKWSQQELKYSYLN